MLVHGKDGICKDMEIMFMYKVLNSNITIGLVQVVFWNNLILELVQLLFNTGLKLTGFGIGDFKFDGKNLDWFSLGLLL